MRRVYDAVHNPGAQRVTLPPNENPTPSWRLDAANALLLFALGLGLRVGILHWTGFDGLAGLDSYAYYEYGLQLRESLAQGTGVPPFFWPLGYPLLCVLASLVMGPGVLAGQAAAVVSGAACSPLIYVLLRQALPGARVAAMLAGLMLGTAYFSLATSMMQMSDLPALMWALCAANAMLRYANGLRLRYLLLAALGLAFAVLTRWVYAVMVAPLGAAALVAYAETRVPWRKVAVHAAAAIALGGALLGLHWAVGQAHGDATVSFSGDFAAYSWSPRHFFQTTFTSSDGILAWPVPPAWYYLQVLWNPWYIAPVLLPALLLGVIVLWRRGTRAASALVPVWVLAMYVFHAGVYYQNSRFPLAYLPPLLLLVAAGAHGAGTWAGTRMRAAILAALLLAGAALLSAVPLGAWWVVLVLACGGMVALPQRAGLGLALAILALLAPQVLKHAHDLHYTHTVTFQREINRAGWIAAQVPEGRQLLVQGNLMTMKYRTPCRVADLFNLDAAQVEAMLLVEREVFVAIRPGPFAQQWAGRAPAQHWAWLQAHATVTPLAEEDGWVVYRVVAHDNRP